MTAFPSPNPMYISVIPMFIMVTGLLLPYCFLQVCNTYSSLQSGLRQQHLFLALDTHLYACHSILSSAFCTPITAVLPSYVCLRSSTGIAFYTISLPCPLFQAWLIDQPFYLLCPTLVSTSSVHCHFSVPEKQKPRRLKACCLAHMAGMRRQTWTFF